MFSTNLKTIFFSFPFIVGSASIATINENTTVVDNSYAEAELASTHLDCTSVTLKDAPRPNNNLMTTIPDCLCGTERNESKKQLIGGKKQYKKRTVISNWRNDKNLRLQLKLKKQYMIVKRLKIENSRKTVKISELHKELEMSRSVTKLVLNNVCKLQKKEDEGDTYSCIMMDQVNIKM